MISERLRKDIAYTVQGIVHHDILFEYFPPRVESCVLEAGCGSGKLGIRYAMCGSRVTLLDIDPKVLEYALRLLQSIELRDTHLPIMLKEGDILNMPFDDDSFDLVFNEGVVEHWEDPERQKAINEMARVSRDTVIIFVPNILSAESRHLAETTIHTYKSMPPKETPFSPTELRCHMEKAGLKDVIVRAVLGDIWSSRQIVGVGKI